MTQGPLDIAGYRGNKKVTSQRVQTHETRPAEPNNSFTPSHTLGKTIELKMYVKLEMWKEKIAVLPVRAVYTTLNYTTLHYTTLPGMGTIPAGYFRVFFAISMSNQSTS